VYYTVQFAGSVTVGTNNPVVEAGYLKQVSTRVIITDLAGADHFSDTDSACAIIQAHRAYYQNLPGVTLDANAYTIQKQGG
jgi:hypothetical protein